MRRVVQGLGMSVVIALLGWQVGTFACVWTNPAGAHGRCQMPKCQDYDWICPAGWLKFPPSDPYPCCRTYTASHGDIPCCQWIFPYDPGCAHFVCFRPPYGPSEIHCRRRNTFPRGSFKRGDVWVCEGETGGGGRCNEKIGTCKPL